jgi:hypothetical protein
MDKHIPNDSFTRELLDLLDETFEHTQGIYLDRGTSFLETLEKVSADEASRPVSAEGTSIAGQVEHVCYYLRVLESSIQKREFGKVDWEESWQVKDVTPEVWEVLKRQLRESYHSVVSTIKGVESWEGEDDIGASLAILTHTAYHLGAVRQMLRIAG